MKFYLYMTGLAFPIEGEIENSDYLNFCDYLEDKSNTCILKTNRGEILVDKKKFIILKVIK